LVLTLFWDGYDKQKFCSIPCPLLALPFKISAMLLYQNIKIMVFICIGVESFDIDMKEQKVTVKGNVQPDEVLQAVSKTGKKTAFWVDEAPPENKPSETAPVASSAENDTKPSEPAPVASEIKASETEPVASAETENKPSETAAIETVA